MYSCQSRSTSAASSDVSGRRIASSVKPVAAARANQLFADAAPRPRASSVIRYGRDEVVERQRIQDVVRLQPRPPRLRDGPVEVVELVQVVRVRIQNEAIT